MVELKQKSEHTNLRVRWATRDRVAALGTVDDSMDDVVTKLLDHYEQCGQVTPAKEPVAAESER